MEGTIKSILVAVLGLLLALVLGMMIGEGTWKLPALIGGGLVFVFVHLLFLRSVRMEAVIIGFLAFGYIVGNRGFAQLSIGGPLFFGEVGLAICFAILLVRFAVDRRSVIPSTALGWAVAGLLVMGAVRVYLDVFFRLSGSTTIMAIRDSAMIYYAGFFFIAYQAGSDPKSRLFVERCIMAGCFLLLPIAALDIFVPGFLLQLTFQGNPLIYQKGDLVTTFLAFSSFYFFLRPAPPARKLFYLICALGAFGGMLLYLQRAGLVGFALAAILLIIARRPQFLAYQAAIATIGLILFLGVQASNSQRNSVWLSDASDKLVSMTDVTGTYNYRGAAGEHKANNNQFRLVWWKSVANETMENAPWFGLGFGYDLAKQFLRTYWGGSGGDPNVRSPHSIWVTMLGRMGIVGLAGFVVVAFLIGREAFRAARAVAQRRTTEGTLAHWCAAMTLLGAATFGVVLEGPMGGILFWTFVGLGASQQLPQTAPAAAQIPEPALSERRRFTRPRRPQLAGARV